MRGRRLVLCPDFYGHTEVDAEVECALQGAVRIFQDLGAQVETVPFPDGSRFDAVFRAIAGPEYAEFHRPFFTQNPDGYGADVRARLAWSFEITADQYVRGLRERERLRRATAAIFRDVDGFLLPSMPCTALAIATLEACRQRHGLRRDLDPPALFELAQPHRVPSGVPPDGLRHERVAAIAPDRRPGVERGARARDRPRV